MIASGVFRHDFKIFIADSSTLAFMADEDLGNSIT